MSTVVGPSISPLVLCWEALHGWCLARNGHDGRVDTTSTPTRSVQENSNVRFNFDWEVAEPPA